MLDINNLFLFFLVFSTISVLRTGFIFVSALLQNPPKKMVFNNRALTFLGVFLSYIITYLINL